MTDTFTQDDRRSALDDFAESVTNESSTALQPAPQGLLAGQVFGAQAVAVYRDTRRVLAQIKELASAAGSDWYYRFPVKDNKTGKTSWIEGPSIKLANDLARLYGNCEVDCRAQDLGSVILYHARFVDLETGYALTRPFQQRKGASKLGGSDEGRREDITFQIGASKAIRNVVVNALQTFSDFAFEEAKNALVEKIGKDIERWRTRTTERISARVDLKRVEAVVGRTADNWLAPDIARVIAMGKAVDDGMATWDETFPPLSKDVPHDPNTGEVLDKFATDEPSMVNTTAAAASGPPHEAAAVDDRPEIVERLLKLAADKTPPQDRLEALDVAATMLGDLYPAHAAFLKTAVSTAATVINGQQPAGQARKYLEGLIK